MDAASAIARSSFSKSGLSARAALIDREAAQACYSAVPPLAERSSRSPAPAPHRSGQAINRGTSLAPPDRRSRVQFPSSMLFAPSVTMPLMAVQDMPLGAQVMGQPNEDARITAMARWLVENLAPSVAA